MLYNRQITDQILTILEGGQFDSYPKSKKAIILYGPRQVGKTTLIREILQKTNQKHLYLDCSDPKVRPLLENKGIVELKQSFEGNDLLVLDEAQLVVNIGQTLKLMVDHIPSLQVIATGSSSFELSNKVNEPLTGRHHTFYLYPISYLELFPNKNPLWNQYLEHWLLYGFYPNILNSPTDKKIKELDLITSDYLFKDILTLENIKNSTVLRNLLEALALQIGSEVSYTELSNLLGVSKNTVERYVDLLEKSYIILKMRPLSRNPRKEISKTKKIYFYDLGLRNSLIRNFNPLNLRQDVGALWENFCIIEKLKSNQYIQKYVNAYFWRNYNQTEIDYLEEFNGKLSAFEFKFNKSIKPILPKDFSEFYHNYNPTLEIINQNTFDGWIRH